MCKFNYNILKGLSCLFLGLVSGFLAYAAIKTIYVGTAWLYALCMGSFVFFGILTFFSMCGAVLYFGDYIGEE